MSFVALGVNLPLAARRAISALGFGLIGFVVAITGLNDAGAKYESFLLVIAYWIGPWLGVMFTDQALRRGQPVEQFLYDKRYANWAGPVAMLLGMLLSILLFSNQTRFVGYVARQSSSFGDIAFEVGFAVAAVTYYLARMRTRPWT
jgi:purine-cytosine permease-like protein